MLGLGQHRLVWFVDVPELRPSGSLFPVSLFSTMRRMSLQKKKKNR